MSKLPGIIILLALSACSGLPARQYEASPSPCAISEASYECQVERYQNVNVD
ncbi:MAG: hypothetical protein JWQ76_1880 [Ramlibacter sp.]|nr:hypothetical protein [Ramlibacter sp.]